MTRRKTHKEFVKEVYDLEGEEYEVIGTYKNTKTKLNMLHNKCGSEYPVEPRSFLRGNRCPICNNKTKGARRKTQEEFEADVYELVGEEYKVVGEYTGVLKKVDLYHTRCKTVWAVTPNAFLSANIRCFVCARKDIGDMNRKTHEQYISEIQEIYGEEIVILDRYKSSEKRVRARHICGHEWDVRASKLLEIQGCPGCNSSKGERTVRRVLRNLGIEFVEQKTFPELRNKQLLSYDFYLPKLDTLIEYQGIQHYEPVSFGGGTDPHEKLRLQQINDNIKRDFAEREDIILIEIPYVITSYDDIESIISKYRELRELYSVKQRAFNQK